MDRAPNRDPYRVDPARHRGHPDHDDDDGILDRLFRLGDYLDDDDHRDPRPLPERRP